MNFGLYKNEVDSWYKDINFKDWNGIIVKFKGNIILPCAHKSLKNLSVHRVCFAALKAK